ncbi:programmed cell death protein 2 isoform X2 [Pseudophryne corroboree]|uniref:programmed cell death protein 2 isoform X2 n=1 Tax=Pseudophryne corroboree TaxID=495146 RepID=UPI0030820EC9
MFVTHVFSLPVPLQATCIMAANVTVVELGFLQESESWRLLSPQFPSKAGGRPAWLGEAGVPGPEALQCGVCGKPLAFLLQVYAPCTGSFHRTVFLFCCRDPKCHQVAENRCFKVFRNQLPRKNTTYSYGPPPDSPPCDGENSTRFQLKCGLRLCRVCGCLGPKSCSKCHKVNFCSKLHQVMDWKLQHKQLCSEEFDVNSVEVPDHKFLFPEYELVTEPEELVSDTNPVEEYNLAAGMDVEICPTEVTLPNIESFIDDLSLDESELSAMAKHETEEEKFFNKFKKRISTEPEQVMPQLLNHLKVDSLQESIDWGILVVYTCSSNCIAETQYAEEFLWKQDVPADTI